jgi:hypothetical protein
MKGLNKKTLIDRVIENIDGKMWNFKVSERENCEKILEDLKKINNSSQPYKNKEKEAMNCLALAIKEFPLNDIASIEAQNALSHLLLQQIIDNIVMEREKEYDLKSKEEQKAYGIDPDYVEKDNHKVLTTDNMIAFLYGLNSLKKSLPIDEKLGRAIDYLNKTAEGKDPVAQRIAKEASDQLIKLTKQHKIEPMKSSAFPEKVEAAAQKMSNQQQYREAVSKLIADVIAQLDQKKGVKAKAKSKIKALIPHKNQLQKNQSTLVEKLRDIKTQYSSHGTTGDQAIEAFEALMTQNERQVSKGTFNILSHANKEMNALKERYHPEGKSKKGTRKSLE